MKMATALTSLLVLLSPAAYASGAPHQKLEFFQGDWTVQGQEQTYLEKCNWFENGRFLVCKAQDKSADNEAWTMSIFGYSADKQAYTHTLFGSSGSTRTMYGWLDGDVWRFTGDTQQGASAKRLQVTITPTEEGFTFRQDVSTNGAPWKPAAEFQYVRVQ